MKRVNVMHLVDTLNVGGAERMAVNIVNALPRDKYRAHLCTTRQEGPLANQVNKDVVRHSLQRAGRFDWRAVKSLVAELKRNDIRILHAHGTSLFIGSIAASFSPPTTVVWHDHWGRHDVEGRPAWLYRMAASRAGGVIAVNQRLAQWSRDQLGIPAERVSFISNFVSESSQNGPPPHLPGTAGGRIVCVANFRPQKDLINLIDAMSIVIVAFPSAHLLMIGDISDVTYADQIRERISEKNLGQYVSIMGQRNDVTAVLQACDIGVLSSASEGLPLSLIEYGWARLPTVATQVGDCATVLDEGRAGVLVPANSAQQLADGLLSLLKSSEKREELGEAFFTHVRDNYNARKAIDQICRIYEAVQKN
jgi:glycosyltransferase involved in cell wall biosynthesis